MTKGLVTFKTLMFGIMVVGGPGGEAGAVEPVLGDTCCSEVSGEMNCDVCKVYTQEN